MGSPVTPIPASPWLRSKHFKAGQGPPRVDNSSEESLKDNSMSLDRQRDRKINVLVTKVNVNILSLELQAIDDVSTVKKAIQRKEGTPAHMQRLYLCYKELDDTDLLGGLLQDVWNAARSLQLKLELVVVNREQIDVLVTKMNGDILSLELQDYDDVSTVKKAIQRKDGTPAVMQRLYLHDKLLFDTNLLGGLLPDIKIHQLEFALVVDNGIKFQVGYFDSGIKYQARSSMWHGSIGGNDKMSKLADMWSVFAGFAHSKETQPHFECGVAFFTTDGLVKGHRIDLHKTPNELGYHDETTSYVLQAIPFYDFESEDLETEEDSDAEEDEDVEEEEFEEEGEDFNAEQGLDFNAEQGLDAEQGLYAEQGFEQGLDAEQGFGQGLDFEQGFEQGLDAEQGFEQGLDAGSDEDLYDEYDQDPVGNPKDYEEAMASFIYQRALIWAPTGGSSSSGKTAEQKRTLVDSDNPAESLKRARSTC